VQLVVGHWNICHFINIELDLASHAQKGQYKKNQIWFTKKFKNEQEFVEALGVDGETVIVFGKRGLSYYPVKVGGPLLDLLNHEVLHEHAFVITPENQRGQCH
jgi:hypothetical protein